jgi:hypothetical protein
MTNKGFEFKDVKELCNQMISFCPRSYKPVYFTLDELTQIYSEPVQRIFVMVESISGRSKQLIPSLNVRFMQE